MGVPEDFNFPLLGVSFILKLSPKWGCDTANQQDWVDHLELSEFCYNNLAHSVTGSTPFQMVTSKSSIVPMTWAAQGQPSSDASEEMPMVTQLDKERKRLWELAKANLEKAHKRYKDFANKSR